MTKDYSIAVSTANVDTVLGGNRLSRDLQTFLVQETFTRTSSATLRHEWPEIPQGGVRERGRGAEGVLPKKAVLKNVSGCS